MFKKIWQSFVRWFRKLFGRGASKSTLSSRSYANDKLVTTGELPPLDDTDREYLFMQLLEGVAHGWQQPRAIGFFNKIRQRVRKSDWLEWLERFGNNLLNAPIPNYELAGRMVQLGQLDCGEIGDLAGEYGELLLNRQAEELPGEFLPILEFNALELDSLDVDLPFDLNYGGSENRYRQFSEVPPELLLDNAPIPDPPFTPQPEAENIDSETREITLEEFLLMLRQDPGLVAELAEQFGIETTDPQIIVNAVVAQMQQQVQQISGNLNSSNQLTPPSAPPEIPSAPPEIPPTPPEIPSAPPEIPSTPAIPVSAKEQQVSPPPSPLPKLEYKPEDPWSSNPLGNEEAFPQTANTPDRPGV